MKANDVLAALGEKGMYVVSSWENSTLPCHVAAYKEPADGRPTDEAEEIAHRADPVAEGEGIDYEQALIDLLGKVK
jgi:hypothetical protein